MRTLRSAVWVILTLAPASAQSAIDKPPSEIAASIPAFPGAEGFGAFAQGGRGGRVIHVTTLADSGPGSLREAVDASGPRIVVFDVSGTIRLTQSLYVEEPFITIAGQTAPGDGICLRDATFGVGTDHVVIRYLRCRLGDEGRGGDAISIGAGRHIILDHCSASWSTDEVLSSSTGEPRLSDLTVQWCFITEALNPEDHGYGSLIRGCQGARYSYHHNLYAHNRGRNPRPGNYDDRNPHDEDPNGLLLDFRNNVIYNWGGGHAGYNADKESVTRLNYVGNYLVPGPNSSPGGHAYQEGSTYDRGWFAGNYYEHRLPENPWSVVTFSGWNGRQISVYRQAGPFETGPIATQEAPDAYRAVLESGGANLPRRDAVDRRIVEDVVNGTGRIINSQDEVGGWPDLQSAPAPRDSDGDGMPDAWEQEHGLNPNDGADGSLDGSGDGYTNVEDYLNGLVR
ncbi:MAG: pectate lyase [Phycisphaerales bacterium]